MKHFFSVLAVLLMSLAFAFPVQASSGTIIGGGETGGGNSGTPTIDSNAPTVEDSIFRSMADDYLDDDDFIAIDEAALLDSYEMMKSSLGSMTNLAIYGMILIVGIFAIAEIIRAIAL